MIIQKYVFDIPEPGISCQTPASNSNLRIYYLNLQASQSVYSLILSTQILGCVAISYLGIGHWGEYCQLQVNIRAEAEPGRMQKISIFRSFQ